MDKVNFLERMGGAICLDFINTVDQRLQVESPTPTLVGETLFTYADLARWAQFAKLSKSTAIDPLLALAKKHPRTSQDVFDMALELRETLFKVFMKVATNQEIERKILENLNHFLGQVPSQILRFEGGTFKMELSQNGSLEHLLHLICLDAMRLLSSKERFRVRICSAPDCGWLFLDSSKSGSRKWCDMNDCGNRAKAKRYYQRSN